MPCFVIQEHAFNPFIAQIVSEGMHLLWGYQKGKKKASSLVSRRTFQILTRQFKNKPKKIQQRERIGSAYLVFLEVQIGVPEFLRKKG